LSRVILESLIVTQQNNWWNYYFVYPDLNPAPSQLDPVHTFTPFYSKIHFNIFLCSYVNSFGLVHYCVHISPLFWANAIKFKSTLILHSNLSLHLQSSSFFEVFQAEELFTHFFALPCVLYAPPLLHHTNTCSSVLTVTHLPHALM